MRIILSRNNCPVCGKNSLDDGLRQNIVSESQYIIKEQNVLSQEELKWKN